MLLRLNVICYPTIYVHLSQAYLLRSLYETKKGNHHTLTLKAGKMDTTRNEHLIIEIGIQLRVT